MSDQPKLWREMSDAEKCELLLANHRGHSIEYRDPHQGRWRLIVNPNWLDYFAYRVKPEPKRETVECYGRLALETFLAGKQTNSDTHRITFDTIDGEPDCASIRMEKIGGAS
jgi:hypothetical protein